MSAYSDRVIADSPRGYWRMGESALPIRDSSGNGNDISGVGGSPLQFSQPSLLTSDPTDKALGCFNGWLSRSTAAAFDVRDVFTIEAWVKLQTLTNLTMAIFSNWSQYLRISASNRLELVATGTQLIATSTAAITDLNLHHVVATKNGATVKLYIDGVDVTGAVTNFTFSAVPTWMGIGVDQSGEGANMTMDEVALYPTALTPAQVLSHYNLGVTAPVTAGPTLGGRGKPPPATRPTAALWPEPKPAARRRVRINRGLGGI